MVGGSAPDDGGGGGAQGTSPHEDGPGHGAEPGLDDASKPGDNPQASLPERAAYAVRRSDRLVSHAIINNERVDVLASWDDLPQDDKNEAESNWMADHLSEYEEPYYEEWQKEVISDAEKEVEKDQDFSEKTWIEWATERGYSEDSALAAIGGTGDAVGGQWVDGDLYVDPSKLRWEGQSEDDPALVQDSPGQMLLEHGDPRVGAGQGTAEHSFDDSVFNSHYSDVKEEEAKERAQKTLDNGPTDSFDGAYQDAHQAFHDMSDEEKLGLAGVEMEVPIREPTVYQPISDGDDYEATKTVVRYLQTKIMSEELESRGIENTEAIRPQEVAEKLWSSWKGNSTSDTGLLMQQAAALELGGLATPWNEEQMAQIRSAAISLSQAHAGRGAGPEGLKSDWHAARGLEIAKAHVHATWAATQYAMQKAGMEEIDLYRAVMLDKEIVNKLPRETVKLDPVDYSKNMTKLPTLQLLRNGAASTSASPTTPNSWQGVGMTRNNREMQRVVMRVKVPREAILSIPAFGQNVTGEEEVVLAGTENWKAWDAWVGKAPSTETVAIKSRRRIMVVEFTSQRGGPGSGHHGHAGRPGEVGGSAPGSGGGSETQEYENLLSSLQKPDGGFTYQPVTEEFVAKGYGVSIYPLRSLAKKPEELTMKDIVDYVNKNGDLLTQQEHFLGGWHDPDSGKVFLDVSVVKDTPEEAHSLAEAHDQLRYFDFSSGQSVLVNPEATSGGAAKRVSRKL